MNANGGAIVNDGTIVAQGSDSGTWPAELSLGGTLANAGTFGVGKGTVNVGASGPGVTITNTGSLSTNTGLLAISGDPGSSFVNTGSVGNPGRLTVAGGMHFVQSGGAISGNPVEIENGATLDDSAGRGDFTFDLGTGYLTGTIASDQQILVQGELSNCPGVCATTTLGLGGNVPDPTPVTNHGTLDLGESLFPTGPVALSGETALTGGTLDNEDSVQIDAGPSFYNTLSAPVQNAAHGTITIAGTLKATSTLTNAGTLSLMPTTSYDIVGGSLINTTSGTLAPQLASSANYASVNVQSGTLTAGGTLAPALFVPFVPSKGEEFEILRLDGGSMTGAFATVLGEFGADYTHQTARPAYIGAVYGTAFSPSTLGPKPTLSRVTGEHGVLEAVLTCRTSACRGFTLTATVTEHTTAGKITAVSARATPTRHHQPAPRSRAKVVTIATAHDTIDVGTVRVYKLALNRTGTSLLKRFRRLTALVTLTAGSTTREEVTLTAAASKQDHELR